ncbi:jg8731 [Pararge aegeria aegeria]|uniref:Jg8731 protein n=1 Tax=Pararge aegeria aegeria TaxID=348720 RepID=A0A8S4S566_9NEOP|nr:jg8731 [Pararge aegeria aegeria]
MPSDFDCLMFNGSAFHNSVTAAHARNTSYNLQPCVRQPEVEVTPNVPVIPATTSFRPEHISPTVVEISMAAELLRTNAVTKSFTNVLPSF